LPHHIIPLEIIAARGSGVYLVAGESARGTDIALARQLPHQLRGVRGETRALRGLTPRSRIGVT
jgi:hypothetical protein